MCTERNNVRGQLLAGQDISPTKLMTQARSSVRCGTGSARRRGKRCRSDFGLLGEFDRIVDVNAKYCTVLSNFEIGNRIVGLHEAEQPMLLRFKGR
jgi:hypothetical protein